MIPVHRHEAEQIATVGMGHQIRRQISDQASLRVPFGRREDGREEVLDGR